MAQENVVAVQIYNQIYNLSCQAQSPQYVQRAAAYLDDKMRQAAVAVGQRASFDLAILAAMEIAEEVLAAQGQKESLLDEADQRISTFTRRLESQEDSSSDPPPRF